MERQELVTTLAQLHAELSRTERVDPETLSLLKKLTADIGRLMDEREPSSPEDAADVTSGLNSLVLKFEAEYPQLSGAIGKVADALANIGI